MYNSVMIVASPLLCQFSCFIRFYDRVIRLLSISLLSRSWITWPVSQVFVQEIWMPLSPRSTSQPSKLLTSNWGTLSTAVPFLLDMDWERTLGSSTFWWVFCHCFAKFCQLVTSYKLMTPLSRWWLMQKFFNKFMSSHVLYLNEVPLFNSCNDFDIHEMKIG